MIRARDWAALAMLSISLAGAVPCGADPVDSTGAWRLLSDPGPAPPVFNIPAGVYDPVRHRALVVENGMPTPGPVVVRVLGLDPEPDWSFLETVGTPPGVRYLGSLVYDSRRDRVLLYSGRDQNETWALTLSGMPEWSRLETTGQPSTLRAGAAAVYDSLGDRMIVFGGWWSVSLGFAYLNDTWALSLATGAWTPLVPEGALPPPRDRCSAVYDPAARRLVVFGGHDSAGARDDVWALSLGDTVAWTELHPVGAPPPARYAAGTICDPRRRRMLVHSGARGDGSTQVDDVWALRLDDPPSWSALPVANPQSGEPYPVDLYDPDRDALLTCTASGIGQGASLPLAEPSRWTFFLPPQPPLEPGPRQAPLLVYDSRRDRFVALGGAHAVADWDLWGFEPADPARWTPIGKPAAPMVWDQSAVYDSLADRFVLFDGSRAWTRALEADSSWRPIETQGPRYGSGTSIALDTRRHRLLVCGGDHFEAHGGGATTREVWALSLDPPYAWTLLGYGPWLYGTASQSTFYDRRRDCLVVMGGYSRSGNSIRHPYGAVVWALSMDSTLTATNLTSLTWGAQPPAPPSAFLSYDPRRDRLFVFAGASAWCRRLDDTGPWSHVVTGEPAPRVMGPAAFDPLRDQFVTLFADGGDGIADQAWALAFGPPPTTLVRADVEFYRVGLSWHSGASIGRPAQVERRGFASGWASLAAVAFDGGGDLDYEDRSVVPGARYAYRLAIVEGGNDWSTDSVWVDVPVRPGLSLEAPRPNPAVGGIRVAFTLPDNGPARLELFDVQGRRVSTQDIGALGPGTHVVDLRPQRDLEPGLYLVRLERAGESRVVRAAVVR